MNSVDGLSTAGLSSDIMDSCTDESLHNETSHVRDRTMPIAIVGIGFRGPGDATDVESFYKLISESREAWSPIPQQKWNFEAFYHPDADRNGTVSAFHIPPELKF